MIVLFCKFLYNDIKWENGDNMSDLFTYVKMFENIDFNHMGLTEADNAVFSRLAYLDFNGCEGKELKEIAKNFTANEEDSKNIAKTKELIKAAGNTKRFESVTISNTKEVISEDKGAAFYGVSFKMISDTTYIAFRGTDEKLMGFYEDAELAYSFPIPSQVAAVSFATDIITAENKAEKFYLGGHSKGGNSALFAFAFVESQYRERIIKTYNNDGPGFPKELVKILIHHDMYDKILNLLPEDSIVGRMLETAGKCKIIKSSTNGGAQHNIFTWSIAGTEFESTKKFSLLSEYLEDSFSTSLDSANIEEIKKAVQTIYNIAVNSGIKTTKDFNAKNIKSMILLLLQITDKENDVSDELTSVIKTLVQSLFSSINIEKFIKYNIPDEILEYAALDKEERKNLLAKKIKTGEIENSETIQMINEIFTKMKAEKERREKIKTEKQKETSETKKEEKA